MLELKSKLLGNRVYFIRFCLSKEAVNELIRDYETKTGYSFGENEETEWEVTDDFEHGLFIDELKKHGIKGVGPLKFRYMSDVAYDRPLIGVCRFIKYDDSFNVEYPVKVNPNINIAIDKSSKELDDLFEFVLLNRGLYYEEASRVINRNAKVDYELRYVSGDQVIEVIKNQHFDMLEDDDIDSSILIGAKIGDFVVLEDDNVTIGAVIQNVTNRYPFNEEDYDEDIVNPILEKLRVNSFGQLKEAFYHEYYKKEARDLYFDDIINQMAQSMQYDVSNEEIKFFDEYRTVPFESEYKNAKSNKEKKDIIKKKLLYGVLADDVQKLEIDYDSQLKIERTLITITLDGNVKDEDMAYEAGKTLILDKMKERNVENLIKEYK